MNSNSMVLTPAKVVEYDPITEDWAMYYEGVLLGYAPNKPEAERRLDAGVYRILSHR